MPGPTTRNHAAQYKETAPQRPEQNPVDPGLPSCAGRVQHRKVHSISTPCSKTETVVDLSPQANPVAITSKGPPLIGSRKREQLPVSSAEEMQPETRKAASLPDTTPLSIETTQGLTPEILQGCKALCDKLASGQQLAMSEAPAGATTVYLPEEYPTAVLKKSGIMSQARLKTAQKVREELVVQGSKCLNVPEAYICGDFIIEERLPVNPDLYHNLHIYTSDPHVFDQAITEMVTLTYEYTLADLLVYDEHKRPIVQLNERFLYPRYDNLTLYTKRGCCEPGKYNKKTTINV